MIEHENTTHIHTHLISNALILESRTSWSRSTSTSMPMPMPIVRWVKQTGMSRSRNVMNRN